MQHCLTSMTVDEIITSIPFRMSQLFAYFLLLINFFPVSFNTPSISQNINNAMQGFKTAQFSKASYQKNKITHDLNLRYNAFNSPYQLPLESTPRI